MHVHPSPMTGVLPDSPKIGWRRRPARDYMRAVLVIGVLLALTLASQAFWTKAFQSELGGFPDEAAHYVTGLLVHDYLLSGRLDQALPFAHSFYDHYPKVALGNWPPGFYLVQGLWGMVFGDGSVSILALVSLLSALVASLVFALVSREAGAAFGAAAALTWMTLPLVVRFTGTVMTEIPLALLSLLSLHAYSRYLDQGRVRWNVLFGLLAASAILTKASAASLAFMPPLAVAFTGKWAMLRKPSFWWPVIIVLVLCGPWSWYFRETAKEGWLQSSPSLGYAGRALGFFPWRLLFGSGLGLGLMAILGVATSLRRLREMPSIFILSLAFVIGVLAFQLIVPAGREERHIIPAMPAVAILGYLGLHAFVEGRRKGLSAAPRFLVPALLGIAALQLPLCMQVRAKGYDGFGSVAGRILSLAGDAPVRILVSSEPRGEGMFVAEVAERDARPRHFVRRGTKVLSTSTWSGADFKLTYTTEAEIEGYLERDGIRFVVLDKTVDESMRTPDMALLQSALVSNPGRFRLIGAFPCSRRGSLAPSGLELYERI